MWFSNFPEIIFLFSLCLVFPNSSIIIFFNTFKTLHSVDFFSLGYSSFFFPLAMLGLHCCTAGLSLVAVSGQLVVLHPHLYQLSFWDLLSPELSSYLFFLHCLTLLQCFFFSHLLFFEGRMGCLFGCILYCSLEALLRCWWNWTVCMCMK